MMKLNEPGVKLLRTGWGCFSAVSSIVVFNLHEVSVKEAQIAVMKDFPDLFEGSVCEVCGYDFPEFTENNTEWDTHRHSLDSCGYPEGYSDEQKDKDLAEDLRGYLTRKSVHVDENTTLDELMKAFYPFMLSYSVDDTDEMDEGRSLKETVLDVEAIYDSNYCEFNYLWPLKELFTVQDEYCNRIIYVSKDAKGDVITEEDKSKSLNDLVTESKVTV